MKLRSSKAACCLGATLVVMMMPVLPKVTDAKPTYEQHESTITDTEVRVASYAANVEEVILTGYEEQQGQMQNKALAISEPYLDVYSADDENSSVNGRLYKNTVVDVLEVNGSMTKISSGNCEGYTKTAALLFNQEAEVIAQTLDDEDILTGYTIEEAEAKEAEEEAARIAEEEREKLHVRLDKIEQIFYINSGDFIPKSRKYKCTNGAQTLVVWAFSNFVENLRTTISKKSIIIL